MSIFTGTANFDLFGKRKLFLGVSAALVAFSIILIIFPGPRYGIDFAGGTDVIIKVAPSITEADLREAMDSIGLDDPSVQRFGGSNDGEFLIQTRTTSSISDEAKADAERALIEAFGESTNIQFSDSSAAQFFVALPLEAFDLEDAEEFDDDLISPAVFMAQSGAISERIDSILAEAGLADTETALFGNPSERRFMVRVQALQSLFEAGLRAEIGDDFLSTQRIESVGPRVGEQLRNDGVKSILFALIGILIYIGFRFDPRYAPGAILALVHDVIITMGILILLGKEMNLIMVAAFLTIIGYSLNDTIVNFDRIRENVAAVGGKPKDLVALTNYSVNVCLSRTLLTSITTFIAVFCLYMISGGMVQTFAFTMMLGVIIGTYSSIFVASSVFLFTSDWMDERESARARIAAAVASKGAKELP